MNEKNIKLLICYHKKAPLFKDNILTPIHVGRANARKRMDHESENYKWLMENMIGDDTGENISDQNDSYNEMTALYWAWKNYDVLGNPDYIGLMHYRRHFVLEENVQAVYNIKNYEPETYYDVLNYSEENMQKLVEGCDFLTHIGKVNNVYKHYIENQRKEDIDLANEIVLEKYPEYEAVMKEYYAGDYSNFCNMNIFSKELFFKYCEWIFSILEEFAKRVDITEKRFFISERLTGIFVAKLMSDKSKKYKVLPIAFMEEPVEVPIAMYIREGNSFLSAVTITSILQNEKNYNCFHFYLFSDKEISEKLKKKYKIFEQQYSNCKVEIVECDISEEFLPLYVSHLLPKVNKCIYISGKVIALFDIGEFYRICSTDDYYMVGVPQEAYDLAKREKKVSQELLVLNCKRIRMHEVAKKIGAAWLQNVDGTCALNEICKGELGYIPWYLFTSEKLSPYGDKLFEDDKRRSEIQAETLWRPFLIYDDKDPIVNNQGVYSIFWWDVMQKIPFSFQHIEENMIVLQALYAEQQIEMNRIKESPAVHRIIENRQAEQTANEEWRNYGLWGKLVFYYKHNGMKNTFAYAGEKLFGKRGK